VKTAVCAERFAEGVPVISKNPSAHPPGHPLLGILKGAGPSRILAKPREDAEVAARRNRPCRRNQESLNQNTRRNPCLEGKRKVGNPRGRRPESRPGQLIRRKVPGLPLEYPLLGTPRGADPSRILVRPREIAEAVARLARPREDAEVAARRNRPCRRCSARGSEPHSSRVWGDC
jgi:hypothetical protein